MVSENNALYYGLISPTAFYPKLSYAISCTILALHGWCMYKYESLCITLTWSNPPSVSYYGIFPVVRQIAPSKTALQICDLHAYSVPRILLVVLSVEFANADTAQKVHYWPDTDNQSNNRYITKCVCE